ncbi:glycosyltransferase family 2 protein [Streptomyces sp. NBC_00063]|uniref:glycosyltransferase family 2 protein n=1 Tax=Streptomyces sp. NBC_00063 TaxID=2975638 RepID=UPI003D710E35
MDDASDDSTGEVLDQIARTEPRVRVVHHSLNSGSCGTPRNTGLPRLRALVMFLDSDDVLAPGAVDRLLSAAVRYGADVAAGACLRREALRVVRAQGSGIVERGRTPGPAPRERPVQRRATAGRRR